MYGLAIRSWVIENKDSSLEHKDYYESIFSQGNGYMGVRGYSPVSSKHNAAEHSTFMAGFFEYIRPGITDMVNQPDFSSSLLILNEYEVESLQKEDFKECLNMLDGTLTWSYAVTDKEGRKTKIEIIRFLSMADIHAAVIRFRITPLNYDGDAILHTGIDGNILNQPISDEQLSDNIEFARIWGDIHTHYDGTSGSLLATTEISKKKIAMEYRISWNTTQDKKGDIDASAVIVEANKISDDYTGAVIRLKVKEGNSYIVDKFVSAYSYRDSDDPAKLATLEANRIHSLGFEQMYQRNQKAWKKIWNMADVTLEAEEELQGAVRYNIFQLIQNDPASDPKASIGARGLMHGRYKGCYFWDTEIFMLPFFLHTNPEAARNLLLYRYNTLEDAVKSASNFSLEGARYSWMASDTGFEQCETWDTGSCEIHITADIAYAMGRYIDVTGDVQFLKDYAAEVFLQTARYWTSRFTYNVAQDQYNLLFVKGPDEYCGVTSNNFYTVQMAVHNIKLALKAITIMKESYTDEWETLRDRLNYDPLEAQKWTEIIAKAVTRFDETRNLWIQDDTFEKLEPLDITIHKEDDIPLYHKIVFDRLQRYQVLKQPDVLMIMALFGEDYSIEQQQATWDYYEPKTLHDSTLSFGIHGLIAAKLGRVNDAEKYFNKSLYLDLKDIMKNTAKEGIHTAALGASWQALVFGYGGIWIGKNGITCKPHLPKSIRQMVVHIQYHGDTYKITIKREKDVIIQKCNFEEV